MMSRVLIASLLVAYAGVALAAGGHHRDSIFDRAADAIGGIKDAVGAHVDNGAKATKKIANIISKQVHEVADTDARAHKAFGKAAGKTIGAGEKALGAGADKLAQIITAPLLGQDKHHGAASAERELQKSLKSMDHGKRQMADAVEKALEKREHALQKTVKKVSKTVEHTFEANSKARNDALKKVVKVLHAQQA